MTFNNYTKTKKTAGKKSGKVYNRMIKMITAFVCAAALILSAGCTTNPVVPGPGETSEGDGLKIVCTIYPIYDWTENVLGDKAGDADVKLLMDSGMDMHSFQPTAQDIAEISNADIFIYVGGESDGWVDDALKEATNKDMKVINLLEYLGNEVKEEELVEGMQEEEEHDHDADADADHDHSDGDADADADHDHSDGDADDDADHEEEEVEYDEHVWLSVRLAKTLSLYIEEAIAEKDPDNADLYKQNFDSYAAKLDQLDREYEEAVESAPRDTILVGDRFPFRYMVDDYGLKYYAAFAGCNAETEASFETITFLADKVDELDLNVILTLESSDQKIADSIKRTSKKRECDIVVMDSLQSVTAEDVNNGISYLDVMRQNLEALKKALN